MKQGKPLETFKGLKVGDKLISLEDKDPYRKIGTVVNIVNIGDDFTRISYKYKKFNNCTNIIQSPNPSSWCLTKFSSFDVM